MTENEPVETPKTGRPACRALAIALALLVSLAPLGVSVYVAVLSQREATALRREEARRTEALLKTLEVVEGRLASPAQAPAPSGLSPEALKELRETLRAFRDSLDRWPPVAVAEPAAGNSPPGEGDRPARNAPVAPVARVTMLGGVRNPGAVPLPPDSTLAECVARAGGPSETASGEIVVRRKPEADGEETVVARVKLADALNLAADVELRDGDVIHVAEHRTGSVFIMGEVNRPGAYPWTPGSTVFQAVVRAGGFTKYANRNAINIARERDGQVSQMRASGNTPLEPNDIVFVTESWF